MKLDPSVSSTCRSGGGTNNGVASNPFAQLVRSKGFIWISTDTSYSNSPGSNKPSPVTASEANSFEPTRCGDEKDTPDEHDGSLGGGGTAGGFDAAAAAAAAGGGAVSATGDAIGADGGGTSAASREPVNETCYYWSHAGVNFELSQLGRWESIEKRVTSEGGGTHAQNGSPVAEPNLDNSGSCGWENNQHLVKISNDGACQELVFIGIGIGVKEQKEITRRLDECLCK
jgi:hypothetical protein